jgi:hypothetical protein
MRVGNASSVAAVGNELGSTNISFSSRVVRVAEFHRFSGEPGNANREYNFGRCLDKGIGGDDDFVRAVAFFLHADGKSYFDRSLENGSRIGNVLFQSAVRRRTMHTAKANSGRVESQQPWHTCAHDGGHSNARSQWDLSMYQRLARARSRVLGRRNAVPGQYSQNRCDLNVRQFKKATAKNVPEPYFN